MILVSKSANRTVALVVAKAPAVLGSQVPCLPHIKGLSASEVNVFSMKVKEVAAASAFFIVVVVTSSDPLHTPTVEKSLLVRLTPLLPISVPALLLLPVPVRPPQ